MLLHGDADFTAGPGGSVAMDEFENRDALVASEFKFSFQVGESLADKRLALFQIDGANFSGGGSAGQAHEIQV